MQETINALIAAIVPILVPAVLGYLGLQLQRLLDLKKDDQAALAINTAVERAAGVVYQQATRLGIPLTDDVRLRRLYVEAVGQVQDRLPEALERKNVVQRDLIQMTQGSVGKAMAADPSTAGPPPTEKEP